MNRQEIFDKINQERKRQDEKWGTEFDKKNTINDWGTYINHYVAKATQMNLPKDEQEKNLLVIATLAVAALERSEQNNGFAPRHYDKDI